MRSGNTKIVALTDALVASIGAAESTTGHEMYQGSTAVFFVPPGGCKHVKTPTSVAEYPAAIYYQSQRYGVRVYAHPIDGWIIGFEYDPDDDVFPSLIYRSQTAWAKDDQLEAAWDRALRLHQGIWSKPPTKQSGKADPKDYRKPDSIYVPWGTK